MGRASLHQVLADVTDADIGLVEFNLYGKNIFHVAYEYWGFNIGDVDLENVTSRLAARPDRR